MSYNSFFENLANGKKRAAQEEAPETTPAEETSATASDDGGVAMGNYEVELARASSSAVASRSAKTRGQEVTHHTSSHAETDGTEGQLTVDVYQTANDIVIESAIAGVRPEDIDVNVTNDSISIRGERRHEETVRESDYLYQECYWGRFARSIILPQEIDPEGADVTFRNGILTVRLPKINKRKTRKLQVRID